MDSTSDSMSASDCWIAAMLLPTLSACAAAGTRQATKRAKVAAMATKAILRTGAFFMKATMSFDLATGGGRCAQRAEQLTVHLTRNRR